MAKNVTTLISESVDPNEPPTGFTVKDHPAIKFVKLAQHDDTFFRNSIERQREEKSDHLLDIMRKQHEKEKGFIPEWLSSKEALIAQMEKQAEAVPHGVPMASFTLVRPNALEQDRSAELIKRREEVIRALTSKGIKIVERPTDDETRTLENPPIELRDVRDLKNALDVLEFDPVSKKTLIETSQDWLSRYTQLKMKTDHSVKANWPDPFDHGRDGHAL